MSGSLIKLRSQQRGKRCNHQQRKNRRLDMNQNDPYAKLGGGALDQELFKTKQTPPPSRNRNSSAKETSNLKTQVTPPSRQDRENKESKSISTDVVKSSLHDV